MLVIDLHDATWVTLLPSYPLHIRLDELTLCHLTSTAPTPTRKTVATHHVTVPSQPIFTFPPMLLLTRKNISTHKTTTAIRLVTALYA